ncbi:MAG: hypothetical protein ACTH2X_00855 [Brachybacterium tyrofermentans]
MTNETPTLRGYGWYAVEITARANDHSGPTLTLDELTPSQLAEQLHEMADMLTEEG